MADRGKKREALFVRLRREQKQQCPLCGCGLIEDVRGIQIDHIIARARGGAHCEANYQAVHPRCNFLKRAKSLDEARERIRIEWELKFEPKAGCEAATCAHPKLRL